MGFGEAEYSQVLKSTLAMEDLINKHSAIMDKYDPQKKIALVVDEWGSWYAPLPGSNPGFLVQQNSMRDAILAALNLNIFARHADRVRMRQHRADDQCAAGNDHDGQRKDGSDADLLRFQNVCAVSGRDVCAGHFQCRHLYAWRHHLAARRCHRREGRDGKLWLEMTNLDPNQPVEIEASLTGITAKSAAGETLTAPKVDSVNTFEAPNTVVPKPVTAKFKAAS